MKTLCKRLLPLILPAALCACASGQQAVLSTIAKAREGRTAADHAPLSPSFSYLRVTAQGRTSLLVLGYLDPHPQGPIEVWYSAQGEVLRLQNGRLKGAAGLTHEWRDTRFETTPDWAHATERPQRWVRLRDTMPGYRFGVEDDLLLRRIPPAAKGPQGLAPTSLIWFEETRTGGTPVLRATDAEHLALPPARYALMPGEANPIYGEQCLAQSVCLSWQKWPPAPIKTP